VRYSALLKRAQYLKQSMLLLTLTSPIVTETSLCIQKSRFSIIPMEWGVKQQGIDYSTSQWGATAERIPVNWWVRLFYTWSQRNMKIEISKKVALGKKKIYNIVFLNFDSSTIKWDFILLVLNSYMITMQTSARQLQLKGCP